VKERKGELFDIIHGHVDAGFGTFTSHLGYDQSYTAIDFARVLALHLECRPVAQVFGREIIKKEKEII
jgi:hypothetical protein